MRLGLPDRVRQIPIVQQVTGAECGAACLTMVLGFHGKACRLETVREAVGCGRDGSSAGDILRAAERFGLRGRGLRVEVADLQYLGRGSVLHWELQHFVVLDRVTRDSVYIIDPAVGRRRVSLREVGEAFTGVVLELEPSEAFVAEARERGPLAAYFGRVLSLPSLWSRVLLVSIIIQLLALAPPILTGVLVDRVVPLRDFELLTVLLCGLGMMTGFHFLASSLRAHLLLHVRTVLDARMTSAFVEHLVSLPLRFFAQRSTGDLVLRLNSNATVREILSSGVLSAALDGIMVALYLALLLVAHATLGLVVLGLAVVHVVVYLLARTRQRELMSRNLVARAKTSNCEVELLGAIETLKSMGAEQPLVTRWSHRFVDVLNVGIERGRLDAWVGSAMAALGIASPVLVLGYGASLVLDETLSLGTMLGLSALATGFLVPVGKLVTTAFDLETVGSYLERIEDVMRCEPERRTGVQPAKKLEGAIEVEGVTFSYDPRSAPVLADVSLQIEPGQFVAIVGASGAGKSTLARVLLGLHEPQQGRVRFDGSDLEQLDLSWVRRQLGVVPQVPQLLATSIRDNIALAQPEAGIEDVVRAAMLARIHDEIAAMPMAYDTVLGDNGAGLSGGQRQRLALARALVARPRIVLLDEATSSLDAVCERRVQTALAGLDCTRIVIAHRLSTVVDADQILVMDGGAIAERGTHAELMARGGVYPRLVAAQLQQGDER